MKINSWNNISNIWDILWYYRAYSCIFPEISEPLTLNIWDYTIVKHFLWFFRDHILWANEGKPLRLQIFSTLEHFLFIFLSLAEEAAMGSLKAERNSISTVEQTALAIIKRNMNKELQCHVWLFSNHNCVVFIWWYFSSEVFEQNVYISSNKTQI